MDKQHWARFGGYELTRRQFVRRTALSAAGLAGAALFGCGDKSETTRGGSAPTAPGGGSTVAAQGKPGGTLILSHNGTIPNLDTHTNISPILSGNVGGLVLNRLVRHATSPTDAPTSWRVVPDLAESWEQPDPTTYIFHLRKNAKWQNLAPYYGRNVIASDIIRSYARQGAKEAKFISAYLVNWITSATAIDDHTVKLTSASPNTQALHGLAIYGSPIVPMDVVDKDGLEKAANWVGTGPYLLKEWRPGVGFVFERNPSYWEPNLPYIDKIELRDMTDASAQLASFLSGTIDELTGIVPENVQTVQRGRKDAAVRTWSSVGGSSYSWNEKTGPFKDARVRLAWDRIIDRRSMVKAIVGAESEFRVSPVSPGLTDFARSQQEIMADMVVDVADAKRLLDAAGYGAGFSAGISGQTAAEQAWIEWGLKQGAQVGIKIVPQVTERTVYLKRQQDHNWDLGQIYGVRAYPDPNDYLQPMFTVGGSKNYGDLVDPVLEGLIKQQLQELNVEKRKQILQDIDRRWTKEFNHATFSFTQGVTSAVAGRLKNYQTRPSDLTQLRYAWLDG